MSLANFSLSQLEQSKDFIRRHIGPSESEIASMLDTVGAKSLDDLIQQTVPSSILSPSPLKVGEA